MNAEKREQQPDVNRQLTLARRPLGTPQRTDFKLLHSPLPEPADGEFLCRSILLSIDPYMRGRMNDASSYTEPVALGAAMVGATVSEVIHSLNARFPVGSIVLNAGGWQDYSVSNGDGVVLIRTAATHTEGTEQTPLSWALGVLGMPGLTA